jgi:hypothetical protein
MWPLLALALFVTGCSLWKDDQEKTPPPSSLPPPPKPEETQKPTEKDVFYDRGCLLNLSCPTEERKAAIYDYVGAVYGETGKVQFTEAGRPQKLTPIEKHYVEEKFGRLIGSSVADPDNVKQYLSRTKEIFFSDLHFPQDSFCPREPDSPPLKFSHPKLGEGIVFYGRHGCGAKYADQFLKSGVELSLAVEPEPWTFFLESYGTEVAQKVKLEEMELFTRIARTLNIPLQNPLPRQASSLEVRKEAAKNSKYTPEDFAVAFVFQTAAFAASQNPGLDPQMVFRDVIRRMAPEFKMEPDDLFVKTRDFLRRFPLLKDQNEESDRRGRILAETSNRMNQKELAENLKQRSQDRKNPKALFVVGTNHAEMIQSIYSNKDPGPQTPRPSR